MYCKEMRVTLAKFIIIFVLIVNVLNSDEPRLLARNAIDTAPDSIAQKTEQRIDEDYSLQNVSIDSLIKLIATQKAELNALEQKLHEKSIELAEKEREFSELDAGIKAIHDYSSLLVSVVSGLFAAGLIFFLIKRKFRAKK